MCIIALSSCYVTHVKEVIWVESVRLPPKDCKRLCMKCLSQTHAEVVLFALQVETQLLLQRPPVPRAVGHLQLLLLQVQVVLFDILTGLLLHDCLDRV